MLFHKRKLFEFLFVWLIIKYGQVTDPPFLDQFFFHSLTHNVQLVGHQSNPKDLKKVHEFYNNLMLWRKEGVAKIMDIKKNLAFEHMFNEKDQWKNVKTGRILYQDLLKMNISVLNKEPWNLINFKDYSQKQVQQDRQSFQVK